MSDVDSEEEWEAGIATDDYQMESSQDFSQEPSVVDNTDSEVDSGGLELVPDALIVFDDEEKQAKVMELDTSEDISIVQPGGSTSSNVDIDESINHETVKPSARGQRTMMTSYFRKTGPSTLEVKKANKNKPGTSKAGSNPRKQNQPKKKEMGLVSSNLI